MTGIRKLVLLAVVATACAQQEEKQAVPSAVETVKVSAAAPSAGIRYSATVEPNTSVSVAFRVGGYVDSVNVEEGDRVQKGAVLARVRQSDYREKFGHAAAARSEAEAGFAQAKMDLDRAQVLFTANALTKIDLDAAVARFESMRARVDSGRAATGEASIALSDTALVAPISGVILERDIERGDLGQPGRVAFVLADTRTVKITFGVPDTMISSVYIGGPMDVTTESLPDRKFKAYVARISPAADPKSRAFEVELHINNPYNELKPGMVVSLEVQRDAPPSLAIPLASVIRPSKSRDEYAVFVVEKSRVRARQVELGEPMGNLVAVRAGLAGGEEIVVSGPALLTEGQLVRSVGGMYASQR